MSPTWKKQRDVLDGGGGGGDRGSGDISVVSKNMDWVAFGTNNSTEGKVRKIWGNKGKGREKSHFWENMESVAVLGCHALLRMSLAFFFLYSCVQYPQRRLFSPLWKNSYFSQLSCCCGRWWWWWWWRSLYLFLFKWKRIVVFFCCPSRKLQFK